jgi:hypothetical protein
MTEAEWSRQFKGLFEMLGFRGYHTWMSKFSEKGFPDWTLCSAIQKRIIFVELKSEIGKVSPAQDFWLDLLKSCDCEAYVWRPSDFDRAAEILRRKPVNVSR